LLARLASAPGTPKLALHAVAAIEAAGGALRVDALAGDLGVSRQHLALQFRQQVGLTPKLFSRICRFRHALVRLRAPGAGGDLAALAADCGYFDQSHLIRDFHDFAASTPAAER
jgi:AraC-like DNA-binding protein